MARTYIGIGLIAMATLVLELAFTRVFSVILYYHFAFMVISLALFGIGAAGVFIYVRSKSFTKARLRHHLSLYSCLFGLAVIVSLGYLLSFEFSLKTHPSWEVTVSLTNMLQLGSLYLLSTLPFFFAGVVISLVIFHYREQIGYVYFSDLAGAALGCLVMPVLMGWLGGPYAVIATAFIGVAAALAFELKDGDEPQWRLPWRSLSTLVVLVAVVAYGAGAGWYEVGSVKNSADARTVFSRWNAYSWISVERSGARHDLFIDALASTRMYSADTVATQNEAEQIAALVHQLRGEDSKVLIVGPGGGVDIVSALFHGSTDITAVELNPTIINDVMLGEFRDVTAGLYDSPGVRVVEGEGRSFIRHSTDRYDVIQATLIDTWAATAAGAFALSENALYTVNAFEDYYDHLEDDGILAMSRWRLLPDREFVRTVGLARTALASRGVEPSEAHRHLFAAQQGRLATLLMKRTPFTADELQQLAEICQTRRFAILHSPVGAPADNEASRLARTDDPEAFYEAYPYDISPVDDDRPFFFFSPSKEGIASVFSDRTQLVNNFASFVLLSLLIIVVILVLVAIALPLVLFRRDAIASERPKKLALLAYFMGLGLAYIVVEIGLLQKFVVFLGHPSFALIVVLFSLLLSSAIGSALSQQVPEAQLPGRFYRLAGSLVALVLVYAVSLGALLDSMIAFGLTLRIAASVVLVVLPGTLMGMMVPIGVRMCHQQKVDELIPWAWGMNGACSVLGSVAAMMVAMNWGLMATMITGALCYLASMAALWAVGRVGTAQTEAPPETAAS